MNTTTILFFIFLILAAETRLWVASGLLKRAKADEGSETFMEVLIMAETLYNERRTNRNVLVMSIVLYGIFQALFL